MPMPLLGGGEGRLTFLFGEGVASFLGQEEGSRPRRMENRQGLVWPRYSNACCLLVSHSCSYLLYTKGLSGSPRSADLEPGGRPLLPGPLPTLRTLSTFAIFSTDMSIDLLDPVLGARAGAFQFGSVTKVSVVIATFMPSTMTLGLGGDWSSGQLPRRREGSPGSPASISDAGNSLSKDRSPNFRTSVGSQEVGARSQVQGSQSHSPLGARPRVPPCQAFAENASHAPFIKRPLERNEPRALFCHCSFYSIIDKGGPVHWSAHPVTLSQSFHPQSRRGRDSVRCQTSLSRLFPTTRNE